MMCLRCRAARSLNAAKQLPENIVRKTIRTTRVPQYSTRLLSSTSRPTLQTTARRPWTASPLPSLSPRTSFPQPSTNTAIPPPWRLPLLPSFRNFSASAILVAKRNTYNPSRRVQKRRHGFLARLRTRAGRKVLTRRRKKGRRTMSW